MKRQPTILIAREGYSGYIETGHDGLGAVTCDPATQYFDSQYTQTCRAFADVGPVAAKPETHWYDAITSIFGGAAKGYAQGQQPVVPAAGAPDWLMPVVIGGVGLIAVVLLTRPRSNPARRRRRSSSRRGARRRNPSTFTKKGERMYRHIRGSYGGDPRAKEIAARTVYARARRTKGLVRKH